MPQDFPPPGFRLFWAGETVSSFGSYVTLLALQLLVVQTLDGTAQDVGWLNSSRWLPYLVLGVLIGAWVDRHPRRPVMITTDLTRASILALIPTAWWFGFLDLWVLLGLVMLFGVASVINDAASQSFVTRLVPRQHLQRGHAQLDGGDAVAQTSGPALAGALVTVAGAPVAVLVDALTYLFSAGVVARLRVPEPVRTTSNSDSTLLREVAQGVRWVYRDSGLTRMAISTHTWFAGSAVLGVVIAPYALLGLKISAFQLGVAAALAGVGAVIGTMVTGNVGQRFGTGGAIIASRAASTIGAVVMAATGLARPHLWLCVAVLGAGQFVYGLGMGVSNSHEMAYRQLLTPDELQARTNITMRSLNRAVLVFGAPLAGILAVTVGSRAALVVAAAIFAVSAGILVFSPVRSDRSTTSAG